MLADEEDFEIWIVCEDTSRGFDAVQRRQADVEQDEIRSKGGGFLNGFRPVGGVGNDLPTRTLSERR